MNTYPLVRSLLFKLDPEKAHQLTLQGLSVAHRSGVDRLLGKPQNPNPFRVMGLNFPNRIGLAAGMDKNGDYVDGLASLGFGFIEIGTVTPRPQAGNSKPRLFRLPQSMAIINRMGFNNKGVDYLVGRVKHAKFTGVLGINIGKNWDTPINQSASDYLIGLKKVYRYADYVTINISSPNTKNLRQLQQRDEMKALLEQIKTEQQSLNDIHNKYVPLVVKIAPDLSGEELSKIAQQFLDFEIDGVIATNTTISRAGVEHIPGAHEPGGLSGAPLKNKATEAVSALYSVLKNKIPIIAAGGIMNGSDAREKIEAGAKLVQVYTGLVYRGPGLVREVMDYLDGL